MFYKLIKQVRYGYLLISILFLTGCPNNFEKLEQAYFNDHYFLTLSYSVELCEDPKKRPKIKKFLQQNHDLLTKKLATQIVAITEQPAEINYYKLINDAQKNLHQLHQYFPRIITTDDILKITSVIPEYEKKTIEKQSLLLETAYQALLYRHVLKYADNLRAIQALTLTQQKRVESARKKAQRQLVIHPIQAVDETAEKLIKNLDQKPLKKHKSVTNPRALTLFGVNVTKLFKSYVTHDLKKQKSEFLEIKDLSSKTSQYYLTTRIGITTIEPMIPELKYIKNIFWYRENGADQWIQREIEYEIYVATKKLKATIEANIVLPDQKEPIATFIFETEVDTKAIDLGNFINMPLNVAEIEYSAEYKSYQYHIGQKSYEELLVEAMKDASKVLSIKVLNTIDIDLDPWLLTQQEKHTD
ncbi:hypothetical protein DID76_00100 [Candidatus Marinamargulisbacteria bacterium SCGC AG-414-C22]|nr:hypothetical protein DID76_00100 [Candidatus Marinamargulisbacteria bacterium SCGC AG-414-C22]